MKSFSAVTLLALPLGAIAITISSPAPGDTWNSTGTHTVTWTSVSTDPQLCNLVLVNENVNPTQVIPINDQIQVSSGSFSFSNVLPIGQDYQIRFTSVNQPQDQSGILAQSGDFTIVNGGPQAQESVSVIGGTSTVLLGGSSTAAAPGTATGTATGTAATTGSNAQTTGGSNSGSSTAAGVSGSNTASASSKSTATGTSSATGTYGSRGFAIALGMIGVGFAAMFVVA